jgi:hypothetical protein
MENKMVRAIVDTFKAWIDELPGSPHRLIVIGEVECPTTGWTVGLSEAVPQGINGAILILQIDAVSPTGPAGQMITRLAVRFEKSPTPNYRQVTIRGGGPDFTLDVGVAQ